MLLNRKSAQPKELPMSTPIKSTHIHKKAQPSKATPQVKIVAKPQPTGLSREELRQIVLEILG
jgi:hypothetical protein